MAELLSQAEWARKMSDGGIYNVQEQGGSYMICIPKGHASEEGIEPGDSLAVVPSDDDDRLYDVVDARDGE